MSPIAIVILSRFKNRDCFRENGVEGVRERTHKVSGDETMHPGAEKNGSQQQESRDRSISITPSHAGARVRCELVVVQMGFGSDAIRTRSKVGLIPWNIKLLCRRVHDLPDFQHAAAASSNNRQPAELEHATRISTALAVHYQLLTPGTPSSRAGTADSVSWCTE